MARCIFCSKVLEDESPEHIILDAFGGTRAPKNVDCSECNHRLGNEIDKPFTNEYQRVLNLANIKTGGGKPPPRIKKIKLEDGRLADLEPGAKPRPRDIHFKRARKGDNTKFEIGAHPEKLALILDDLARGLGISVSTFLNRLRKFKVRNVPKPINETSPFTTRFGVPEHERSVLKSALVLWAEYTSTDEVRGIAFERARKYVTQGIQPGNHRADPWMVEFHFGQFPLKLGNGFAPTNLTHSLMVWSDADGRLVGFYQLFGYLSYSIRITDCGATPSKGILLARNPLDRKPLYKHLEPSDLSPCSKVENLDMSQNSAVHAVGNIERICRLMSKVSSDLERSNYGIGDGGEIDYEKLVEKIIEIRKRKGLVA